MDAKENDSEDEEKVLKCNGCDEEVEECNNCSKNFKVGDEIICLEGQHHFCSEKCLNEYIDDEGLITTAKVYLGDEE